MSRPEMAKPGTGMVCDMIRPEVMSRPESTAMQTKPGTDMICDKTRPKGMSRPVGTAMQTKPGTDMIRPEGMSRPKGTAMSRPETAMPGTGIICEPEALSRPVDPAMQTEPGTNMICDMIRHEGTSRPVGTAMQTKPGTAITAPKLPSGHGHEPPRRRRFAMKAPSCRRGAAIPLYSSCLRLYLMCTAGVFAFVALHSLFCA
jgi:hypothetical protein